MSYMGISPVPMPSVRQLLSNWTTPVYFACRHCYELTYRSCQEHDGRLDRLCKNPLLLQQMLNSGKWSSRFLALKAALKLDGI